MQLKLYGGVDLCVGLVNVSCSLWAVGVLGKASVYSPSTNKQIIAVTEF